MTELYPRLILRRALLVAGLVAAPLLALTIGLDVPGEEPSDVEPSRSGALSRPPTLAQDIEQDEVSPLTFLPAVASLPARVRRAPPPTGPVGRALEWHRFALERCYAKERQRDPGASGDVLLRWYVHPDGEVDEVRVLTQTSKRLASCLSRTLQRVPMPGLAPKTGAWVKHTFKLLPRTTHPELTLTVAGWERLAGAPAAAEQLAEHVNAALPSIADCYAARADPGPAEESLVIGLSDSGDRVLLGLSAGASADQRCLNEVLWRPGPPPAATTLAYVARMSVVVTVDGG